VDIKSQGPSLGFPEGYAVLDISSDRIAWRFESYGWQSPTAQA
jgi:hypothetical protein